MKINSLANLGLLLKRYLGSQVNETKELSSLTETEYLLSGKNGEVLLQSLKEVHTGNIKEPTRQ